MKHFDPDLLRTLVAFADAGSLARAAASVGRTPSAVTAQMQRLEDSVGVALLEASGRGRTLTEAGDRLVSHARRILAANNEAWLSITGAAADGRIGLGVTQDFADTDLPGLLNLFARSHPRIRIDLRVGRSSELAEQLKDSDRPRLPMSWPCSSNRCAGSGRATV
jgi:DNA-binding transcriptional LysR family regulator